jgi:hypothetical protein
MDSMAWIKTSVLYMVSTGVLQLFGIPIPIGLIIAWLYLKKRKKPSQIYYKRALIGGLIVILASSTMPYDKRESLSQQFDQVRHTYTSSELPKDLWQLAAKLKEVNEQSKRIEIDPLILMMVWLFNQKNISVPDLGWLYYEAPQRYDMVWEVKNVTERKTQVNIRFRNERYWGEFSRQDANNPYYLEKIVEYLGPMAEEHSYKFDTNYKKMDEVLQGVTFNNSINIQDTQLKSANIKLKTWATYSGNNKYTIFSSFEWLDFPNERMEDSLSLKFGAGAAQVPHSFYSIVQSDIYNCTGTDEASCVFHKTETIKETTLPTTFAINEYKMTFQIPESVIQSDNSNYKQERRALRGNMRYEIYVSPSGGHYGIFTNYSHQYKNIQFSPNPMIGLLFPGRIFTEKGPIIRSDDYVSASVYSSF